MLLALAAVYLPCAADKYLGREKGVLEWNEASSIRHNDHPKLLSILCMVMLLNANSRRIRNDVTRNEAPVAKLDAVVVEVLHTPLIICTLCVGPQN